MDQAIPVFKVCRFLSLFLLLGLGSVSARASEPYKIYVVNTYGTWDIVCDRYVVKKGDHIWEILRRKGRIAEENFPQFVEILKDMNPHIQDVDKIYPGQAIVIPLKQVPSSNRGTPEDREPRYVTIPMIPDVLFDYHTVESGDYLSQIVTRHLNVSWHEIPDDYFETFRRLNPAIEDLDLIYPGQMVRIPELLVAEAPEMSLANTAGSGLTVRESREEKEAPSPLPEVPLSQKEGATVPSAEARGVGGEMEGAVSEAKWRGLLSRVARQMGGRLLASGYCYFPGEDGKDVPLDLSRHPVIELPNGCHVVFQTGGALPKGLLERMEAAWRKMAVVEADRGAADRVVLERLFAELFGDEVGRSLALPEMADGIRVVLGGDWVFSSGADKGGAPTYFAITLIQEPAEATSSSVLEYLGRGGIRVVDVLTNREEIPAGDREDAERLGPAADVIIEDSGAEAFVSTLADAMGYQYEPQVPISFDYAGFQVETTANIIYGKAGMDVVVDFGTFYGDAVTSIEEGGLKVVSVASDDDRFSVAANLLNALEGAYTESPELFAADREVSRATTLVIPGSLVSPAGGKRGVLTERVLPSEIVAFLHEKGIAVWQVSVPSSERRVVDGEGLNP